MSMKPGARTRPLASIIWSSFDGLKFPMVRMRSPEMRTLTRCRGAPVPSATWALRMTVEDDLSCECAKTQANAKAKSTGIPRCRARRNVGFLRSKIGAERSMHHLYNNKEGAGKGHARETANLRLRRELSRQALLRRACRPKSDSPIRRRLATGARPRW